MYAQIIFRSNYIRNEFSFSRSMNVLNLLLMRNSDHLIKPTPGSDITLNLHLKLNSVIKCNLTQCGMLNPTMPFQRTFISSTSVQLFYLYLGFSIIQPMSSGVHARSYQPPIHVLRDAALTKRVKDTSEMTFTTRWWIALLFSDHFTSFHLLTIFSGHEGRTINKHIVVS